MPLNDRDRRALTGGGLVIAVLLAYLLFWTGEPAPPPSQPPEPTQAVTAPQAQAVPQAAPAAAPADASQLRLHGVMGGGAIIGLADGSQRYIPLGREILPGVTLKRLEVHHAILDSGGMEIRLGFDGATDAASGPTPAQPANPSQNNLAPATTISR